MSFDAIDKKLWNRQKESTGKEIRAMVVSGERRGCGIVMGHGEILHILVKCGLHENMHLLKLTEL